MNVMLHPTLNWTLEPSLDKMLRLKSEALVSSFAMKRKVFLCNIVLSFLTLAVSAQKGLNTTQSLTPYLEVIWFINACRLHFNLVWIYILFNNVKYSSCRYYHDLLGPEFDNLTPIRHGDADNLARIVDEIHDQFDDDEMAMNLGPIIG